MVASYASDYGVGLAEAQRRLARIPEMQGILAALRAAEPERLAGWGIDHDGPMTAWVWLVGTNPPSSAAAAIAASHTDVEIRTGAKVTFASLAAAQDAFGVGEGIGAIGNTGAADATQIDISDMLTHTAVDLRANALEIGIDLGLAPAAPSGALDPGQGQSPPGPLGTIDDADNSSSGTLDLIAQLLAPHLSVPYNVIEAEPVEDFAAFEGGHVMGSCTSGFAAYRSSSSEYGMITAGHCDADSYTTQGVRLSLSVRAWTPDVDAAFFAIPAGSSHQVTNQIVCVSNGLIRDTCPIRSIGPDRLRMAGAFVCNSGKESGVSCGRVNSIRYKPSPDDGCDALGSDCNAVYVRATGDGLRGCRGDSGGPVYSWSSAYGVFKGGQRDPNCTRVGTYVYFSGSSRFSVG